MSISRSNPSLALLALALLLPVASGGAQTNPLYVPRAVKRAIVRGTRTSDGRPGPRYWQNRAHYSIDVTTLPPDRTVRGIERITYLNESPDTLAQIVVKLFMNVHRAGAPRVLAATPDYLTDGVQIDSFAIDGLATAWRQGEHFTTVPVTLPTPLLPHDSLQLAFRWHYELARRPAREGAIDSTTFFLAYFYPRVAVYDDYNGWDTTEFTDLQEFYSDFNDYDLTVHVPANFIVWGTGTLTNVAQLLRPAYLQRFTSSLGSDETIHVATRNELAAGGVTTPGSGNAWHFAARNVPDVALGLSDHYDWDAASVVVDGTTHRRASVQAAYHDSAADFHAMVQMARRSLAFVSSRWPGVPYPYEKTTIFQGGAGMEYPMMVNDESYADTSVAGFVAGHEIAHTYMPFYMGIDETRYAFMDEGWAAAFEYLINTQSMGSDRATQLFQQVRVARWAHDPSPLEDLPITTPADALREVASYRNNAYGKAALGYLALKDYLGDATFGGALHTYMDRWHGKHPSPWDFFATFDDATGRDLGWFWNEWYFSNGYIDLAVRAVTKQRGGYAVTLENVGGFGAPVDVVLTYTDGSTQTVHQTIGLWQRDRRTATVTVPTTKTVRSLSLAGGIWMDADTTNDVWSASARSASSRALDATSHLR